MRMNLGKHAVAVVVLAGVLASPAAAADTPAATAKEVTRATERVSAAPPTTKLDALTLPSDGSKDIRADGLALALPAQGAPQVEGNTAIYQSDESPDAQIAVQAVDGGVRALVNIDSPSAPEKYDFVFGDEVVSLEAQPDGSVITRDAAGEPIGQIDAPWARDAVGTAVPTHYEINGTTLTQVVAHHGGDFTYGITADPKWARTGIHLLKVCLGWTIGSELGLRALFPNVKTVAKFIVRRIGWFAAISCGGSLIREAL